MILLFLAALALSPAERPLVGSWECKSGPCIDPEIELAVEDGKRVFRSWLHNRPSAFGSWSAERKTLMIVDRGDSPFEYRIVRVTKRELVLHGEGDKQSARYRRLP